MGNFEIKIRLDEEGDNDVQMISLQRYKDGFTWKDIYRAFLDSLTGLGYVLPEDIKEVID